MDESKIVIKTKCYFEKSFHFCLVALYFLLKIDGFVTQTECNNEIPDRSESPLSAVSLLDSEPEWSESDDSESN